MKKIPEQKIIHVRLPAAERDVFQAAAEKQSLNFTTWLRLTLRKAVGMDKR